MADLKLDAFGDIDLTDGKMSIVRGDDAILQHLRIRYRFVRGEWELDTRIGIPYFQEIFVKNPDLAAIRSTYRRATVTTPGISSVAELELSINPVTRRLAVFTRANKQEGGEPLVFDEEFVLP